MNPQEKFLICLYSDANFLAINILENLIANNCYVNIVTDDVEKWREITKHIASQTRFSILSKSNLKNNTKYSYVIACIGFININYIKNNLKFLFSNKEMFASKTLLVFPQEAYGLINSGYLENFKNIGIIYTSDLIGPRINLESNLRIARIVKEIINNRKIESPIGETLYPVFVSDAAKQITRWMFSFGPYGKEIFLRGGDVSYQTFWLSIKKLVGSIDLVSTDSASNFLPATIDKHVLTNDLPFMLNETFSWLNTNKSDVKKKDNPKIKRNQAISKIGESIKLPKRNIRTVFLVVLIILIFPLALVLISLGLTYSSYKQMIKGRMETATWLLSANKAVSKVNYYESQALAYIPILGNIYKETGYLSDVSVQISDLGKEAIPLIEKGEKLLNNILQNDPYSVEGVLNGAEASLQNMYKTAVYVENISNDAKANGIYSAEKVISKIDIGLYKNIILQSVRLVERLPDALGEYSSKTYLVLFQNNMEIRPTGGFIGSFGLLTLDRGRLSEFNVSDVYSADGQLKGHVEPPMPIKEYLGEANWWLRDSNWDPDFPISAKRAEWFLDKEIDKQVDGVIAIDLNPIKDFLKYTGPVNLSDYGLNITELNFYEKVQSEVQDNAFPGTHKKASFLTALSRNLIEKARSISFDQKISTIKLVYKNLQEKHIQAYLHDEVIQNSLSQLNWAGSVFVPYCGENCYSDLLGIIEANVGVNKSNYFIKRKIETNVKIASEKIERKLTLTVQNTATQSLGPSGIYKSYIRLLVPENAENIKVKSKFGQNTQFLEPDIINSKGRKEAGVFIEILAGETKDIEYSWESRIDGNTQTYNLFVRKQSGIESIPMSIVVDTPQKGTISPISGFALTGDSNYLYNTALTSDLSAKFSI